MSLGTNLKDKTHTHVSIPSTHKIGNYLCRFFSDLHVWAPTYTYIHTPRQNKPRFITAKFQPTKRLHNQLRAIDIDTSCPPRLDTLPYFILCSFMIFIATCDYFKPHGSGWSSSSIFSVLLSFPCPLSLKLLAPSSYFTAHSQTLALYFTGPHLHINSNP